MLAALMQAARSLVGARLLGLGSGAWLPYNSFEFLASISSFRFLALNFARLWDPWLAPLHPNTHDRCAGFELNRSLL